jgi:hypothetical protein
MEPEPRDVSGKFACRSTLHCAAMSFLDTFFTNADGNGMRHCNHCSSQYSLPKGGGSGSLRKHVKLHHVAHFEVWQAARIAPPAAAAAAAVDASRDNESDVISVPSTPSRRTASACSGSGGSAQSKRQRTLSGMFAPLQSAALPAALARCFATNHIAYNVASSPSFLALVDVLRGSIAPVPQRNAVKSAMQVSARAMRARLLQRLIDSKATVAIAIDGWTNIRQGKVTNVVLLCGGAAYYWCSIANMTERSDAAWMERALQPVITEVRTHCTRRPRGDHEATTRQP